MNKKVTVDSTKCVTGHMCPIVYKCPKNAIVHLDISDAPTIDYDKCTHCGICVKNSWCKAFYIDRELLIQTI